MCLKSFVFIKKKYQCFAVASLRSLHDNSGDPVGEHVDRYDGQHISEDSGDAERVAAAVGTHRAGGGTRGAACAAASPAHDLQPAYGQRQEGAGLEDQPKGLAVHR